MSRWKMAAVAPVAAALAMLLGGCAGDDDPGTITPAQDSTGTASPADTATAAGSATERASATPAATIPDGWKSFDKDGIAGAIREAWKAEVLDSETFRDIAVDGLSGTSIDESSVDAIEGASPDELSAFVLLVGMQDDYSENINVQPCFPGGRPVGGDALIELYEQEFGATGEIVGMVTYRGDEFEAIRVTIQEGLDSYQVFIGNASCASIVTMTADDSNDQAFADLATFVELLDVRAD